MNTHTHTHTHLKQLLIDTKLPKSYSRKSVGTGYTNVFGNIKPYIRCSGECLNNKKYPELYNALCEYGKTVPVKWSAIQVNKNYLCKPHKDGKNVGDSFIIGFGKYTGGELNIEGIKYDIRKGLVFNGHQNEHWVEPFEGDRYSVIYFNAFENIEHKNFTNP